MNISRFSCLAVLIALFAAPLSATTYIVPSDAEMIQKSDDIVVVTGVSAQSERTERGSIVTRYTLRVVETLKGGRTVGSHLVLTEVGGEVGEEFTYVPGAPEYQPGERYLVFTTANRDFEPATFGMSLGQFRFVDRDARRLAVRQSIHGYDQNFEVHEERARDAQRFVTYIRDTVAQRGGMADYFVPHARQRQIEAEWQIEANAVSRTSYLMRSSGGVGFRWQNPSANWVRSGIQPGTSNADTAVNVAFSQWNGTASSINYTNAGVDHTALGGNGGADGKNAILYGDPTNEIPDGSGIAGQGGVKGSSQYTLSGETFWNVREGDVVIANMSFSQSCLNGVMTHEIGHTLGFRHSNQVPSGMACGSTAECTSSAIMNSSVNCGLNGILQGYDRTAAETVYGDGSTAPPTCNPPTVTTQPQSRTVTVGSPTTIGVVTSGTGPFTYQWFNGDSGNTSSPVNGANSSSLSITMNAAGASKFWVRIGHSCDNATVNSVTATITATVLPPTCSKPLITTQPADSTINSGQAASLSIAFSSGAAVKWYRGNVGDKSNQIGTTASVSTGALAATTKFWAEVTNTCGAVSSRQVTVTVRALSELVPMLDNRFVVQVRYKNQFDGNKQGKLQGRSLFSSSLSDTAVFTFGDQNVIELMVRLSDARPFDNNIHVFLGGLSDVEFAVVVTDSKTGIVHEYKKPANQLVGVIDRNTFPASVSVLPVFDALRDIRADAETSTIRLLNNRFQVRMRYRNQFTTPATTGYLNARSIASTSTTETAVFFFGENAGSAEWMVRFSDARPFANRIDMFHGGLSDVELTIEVLDTKTGARKEYTKAPFSLSGQVDRTSYKP
ncbi:MAG TPA: M57 family metalloprotease [Thermoanaerobaculia bacterium]